MSVYNKKCTISRAINDLLRIDLPSYFKLIVVDDGSADKTRIILAELNDYRVIVRRHPANRAKGAALRSAASLVAGMLISDLHTGLKLMPLATTRSLNLSEEGLGFEHRAYGTAAQTRDPAVRGARQQAIARSRQKNQVARCELTAATVFRLPSLTSRGPGIARRG